MWTKAIPLLLFVVFSECSILKENCDYNFSLKCFKLDVLKWLDQATQVENVSILPGVELVRENDTKVTTTEELVKESAREFPNDPEARLDSTIWKKLTSVLNSRSLKINFNSDDSLGTARGKGGGGGGLLGGGGGGGKKGGGGGGLAYLLGTGAIMTSTLFAIALKGLALLAGKALFVGSIALLISAIIGLKSLTSHSGGGHSTHEVITKPIVTHGHSDGGGWGRNYIEPLPVGLQPGYRPAE